MSNHSASGQLEGWQLEDNKRPSWDILWTCLSTILACTWTTLHLTPIKRNRSIFYFTWYKSLFFFGCLLAPEFMAGWALEENRLADHVAKRCNKAFDKNEKKESRKKRSANENETKSLQDSRWGRIQGFCLLSHGGLLQTTDGWTFPVSHENVVFLIETRLINPSHLREAFIQDRSKADSLAKAFALLQSLWVTCNVIARAAYQLPVSALEIAVTAYVFCAFVAYAAWWHKPKDMILPIIIHLPYSSDDENIPSRAKLLLSKDSELWVHENDLFPENTTEKIWTLPGETSGRISGRIEAGINDQAEEPKAARGLFGGFLKKMKTPSVPSQGDCSDSPKRSPLFEEIVFVSSLESFADVFYFFLVGIIFCGIHLAAWNFDFPTMAERVAWRVFSLISIGMAIPMYGLFVWAFIRFWSLRPDNTKRSFAKSVHREKAQALTLLLFPIYAISRVGCIILMFISLRALPIRSYVTVDWLATIPHV